MLGVLPTNGGGGVEEEKVTPFLTQQSVAPNLTGEEDLEGVEAGREEVEEGEDWEAGKSKSAIACSRDSRSFREYLAAFT